MVFSRHIQSWISEGVSYLFIILLTYAAISKLLDYKTFRVQVDKSPIISPFAGLLSWGVPKVEIFITLLLFSSRLRLISFYTSFLLMVIFTTYIIFAQNFADTIPRFCGGVIAFLSKDEHLVFKIGWILLVLFGISLSHKTIDTKNIDTHPFLNSKNEINT